MLLKTWKFLLWESTEFISWGTSPRAFDYSLTSTFSLLCLVWLSWLYFSSPENVSPSRPSVQSPHPLISVITQSRWIQWGLGSRPEFLLSNASFKGVSAFMFWNHGHFGNWFVLVCSFCITGHIISATPPLPQGTSLWGLDNQIERSDSNKWNDGYAFSSVQFSSVIQSCPTLCDPMNRSTPGLPVHHQLLEFTQTHVHWAGDAIQPSYFLLSPSPPTFNLSQHQGLFKWVSLLHQVGKYWSFSFNISPSSEHPGLISFRMGWLDLLRCRYMFYYLLINCKVPKTQKIHTDTERNIHVLDTHRHHHSLTRFILSYERLHKRKNPGLLKSSNTLGDEGGMDTFSLIVTRTHHLSGPKGELIFLFHNVNIYWKSYDPDTFPGTLHSPVYLYTISSEA